MAEQIVQPKNPKFQDLTGIRFGRLTVVQYAGYKKKSQSWLCLCDCSTERVVHKGNLTSGRTISCGCYHRECAHLLHRSHGASRTAEYCVWNSVKNRCLNKNVKSYKDYGERGITMCDEWRHSFEAFLRDMGLRPSSAHTIERRDNTSGYCKENCKWATRDEQARNKRNNHLITYNGETKCLAAWTQQLGLQRSLISGRIKKGWSIEKALTTPTPCAAPMMTLNGITMTVAAWARHLGWREGVLRKRRVRGWSDERTLTTPLQTRRFKMT